MAEASTVQLKVAANNTLPGKYSLSNFVYVSPVDFKRICEVGSSGDSDSIAKYGVLMATKGFVFNIKSVQAYKSNNWFVLVKRLEAIAPIKPDPPTYMHSYKTATNNIVRWGARIELEWTVFFLRTELRTLACAQP